MDADLVALAEAHGVATWYEDWHRERRDVVGRVGDRRPGAAGRRRHHPGRGQRGAGRASAARDEAGCPARSWSGTARPRPLPGPARSRWRTAPPGESTEIPADLPLGWHRLRTAARTSPWSWCRPSCPSRRETWGWMLQLYALHSAGSWGMGDLGDLRDFVADGHGAGLILLNPLHAITPTLPVPSSPYSPSSRRFANPLYLRVADTDEYRRADPALRAQVDALRPAPRPTG